MSQAALDVAQTTVFTGAPFCRLWADVFNLRWESLDGAEDLGLVFSESSRLGLRDYRLAPRGLYWTASGADEDQAAWLVESALAHLRRRRLLGVTWNFRYDSRSQLERVVRSLGSGRCRVREASTHVLTIEGRSFDEVFSDDLKPVTRRKIRRAREAVEIRAIDTPEDFDAHDSIYRAWAEERGIEAHPASLFPRLNKDLKGSAVLFGAFAAGRLVAAVQLFHDRREWFYWHGVRDPERDTQSAMNALLAHGLEGACTAGAHRFNFGASNGIPALEFFKERWGAERRTVWSVRWLSPLWSPVLSGWKRIRGRR